MPNPQPRITLMAASYQTLGTGSFFDASENSHPRVMPCATPQATPNTGPKANP